ncbi:hypothetical protein [Rubinisphaera margarita]|uniref:hypothetical protein n=1 Tax=Rubinisphaera margarita TaxID=2909586 RepID=UPI001EE98548|nr:hypothetical protein [Rubinisphaera margarita]MCG6156229.1 hypothetical protein [Rubinisphaera margarita]
MAKCDQGYKCEICGEPVKNIIESALYLRYVLGEVQLHELFGAPERHLHCDHDLCRFIRHEKFVQPEEVELVDPADDQARVERVTRGYERLREVVGQGIPITDYPLK